MTELTITCPMCGHKTKINVNKKHLDDWKNGKLIQRAFPELNADERELLITGFCYKCQLNIFGK